MRILVLGAGAVGGYFGGRIMERQTSARGATVTFLVRPGRAAQLQQEGLHLQHPNGSLTSLRNISTIVSSEKETVSTRVEQPFDMIVLACKAYGLDGALEAIADYVHNNVVILPLLNGMAHLDIIQKRFPAVTVWGGTCGIVASLDKKTGIIHRMTSAQFVKAGILPTYTVVAADGQIVSHYTKSNATTTANTVDLLSFIEVLQDAGIDAEASDNILQAMWDKWTFLATLGAATSLMRATVGEILSTSNYGPEFLLSLYHECNAVAAAEGSLPEDLDGRQAGYRRIFLDQTSIIKASICRDMESGGETEADHLLGDLIQRAKRHQLQTPLLSIAYMRLQIHEAQITK